MKAYLEAFSGQLTGIIDLETIGVQGRTTEIYLPFLPRMEIPTEENPMGPMPGVVAAKFVIIGFIQTGPGLGDRIPHYKFVGLQ
jgi:hypothetical protein